MHPRALELIRLLRLGPHPEGGSYRETFRSETRVSVAARPERSALTSIHFLLAAGEFSAWHRVRADEAWHWHEGEPLELLLGTPDLREVQCRRIGVADAVTQPSAVVPAGWWQAARPLGTYALCSCAVAPGFEFEDFVLLRDFPERDLLQSAAPELTALL